MPLAAKAKQENRANRDVVKGVGTVSRISMARLLGMMTGHQIESKSHAFTASSTNSNKVIPNET